MTQSAPSIPPERQPGRTLLVRPSALGDVCRTVPVLATLRVAFPDAVIDWLVQDTFADAIAAHPMLDTVVGFPRAWFSRGWRSPAALGGMLAWAGDLRRAKYEIVYDLQGLGRSGLITWGTRAPRRVGFRSAREGAWLGYTVRHDPPTSSHIVDQMLELMEREGFQPVRDMRLYTPSDAAAWWAEERARADIHSPYAVLATTSRWESKRWPIDRWKSLIDPLRARGFRKIIIIGGPTEREQIAALFDDSSSAVIDLVARCTVGQTMAVIEQAGLVIANDSAPLHMAVGFDRPVVALFGPTDPAFVGPYRREDSVLRVFDPARDGGIHFRRGDRGGELMSRITVEMVMEKVDAVLSAKRQAADSPAIGALAAPESARS